MKGGSVVYTWTRGILGNLAPEVGMPPRLGLTCGPPLPGGCCPPPAGGCCPTLAGGCCPPLAGGWLLEGNGDVVAVALVTCGIRGGGCVSAAGSLNSLLPGSRVDKLGPV